MILAALLVIFYPSDYKASLALRFALWYDETNRKIFMHARKDDLLCHFAISMPIPLR